MAGLVPQLSGREFAYVLFSPHWGWREGLIAQFLACERHVEAGSPRLAPSHRSGEARKESRKASPRTKISMQFSCRTLVDLFRPSTSFSPRCSKVVDCRD